MSDETILLVEDQDILRKGLQSMLENAGFQVIPAVNGRDALGLLEIHHPDLILSDITMPEMDGYAFYEALRANTDWLATPFIFLTARGERDDFFAGKRMGVEDYLVKPVNRQELVTTVRSRLDRSKQLMFAQLQQASRDSLILLANAIELRDRYTRGHVERVMEYAHLIADRLGWTASQMEALEFGAILHDIGKIYIRESILRKAGSLNDEEWAEMKTHTIVGAELLQPITYLEGAIPIIRNHHERWDGRGYPDGLAGNDIPIGARIVSVVDAFDAMTTERVYRESSTLLQAKEEILSGSGRRYDPVIVQAFMAAWDKIEAISSASL